MLNFTFYFTSIYFLYGGLRFEIIIFSDPKGKSTYQIQFEEKVEWGVNTVAAVLLHI
jgi:hypothetical protein